MKRIAMTAIVVALMQVVPPGICMGEDQAASPIEDVKKDSPQDSTYGVDVGMEVASAYNRRGLNSFQSTSQHDSNGVVSPRIRWSIMNSGVWLKYAGFYQVGGDNENYMVDTGHGHEQDVALGWTYPFSNSLETNLSFTYLFFPFAMEEMTGARNPSYIEPAVWIRYSPLSLFHLQLNIVYYYGIQKAIDEERYLYINPTILKSFNLSSTFSFEGGLGFGYKLFNANQERHDNVYDIDFHLGVPIHPVSKLYVTPNVHLTWTNLSYARAGNEYFVWFALDFGVNL